jgi:hypothetical protein
MAIPDDFDPQPTIPTGGLDRMIQIWEASRDTNAGGYGGSVLQQVDTWLKPSAKHTTSCSPFTATCIGMMYDPGGATDDATVYKPVINTGSGTLALPVDYYILHNGFYFAPDPNIPAAVIAARRQQFLNHGWKFCDDSALATVFFNLGYAIDIRDIRRGDLLGIDWASGHGHAAFVWDVHTDEDNAVVCFQFLSANGYAAGGRYFGPGVSVSAPQLAPFITERRRHVHEEHAAVRRQRPVPHRGVVVLPARRRAHRRQARDVPRRAIGHPHRRQGEQRRQLGPVAARGALLGLRASRRAARRRALRRDARARDVAVPVADDAAVRPLGVARATVDRISDWPLRGSGVLRTPKPSLGCSEQPGAALKE